jgi:hypothetical protein
VYLGSGRALNRFSRSTPERIGAAKKMGKATHSNTNDVHILKEGKDDCRLQQNYNWYVLSSKHQMGAQCLARGYHSLI